MSNTKTISGTPPSDYKEVLYWKISEKTGRIVIMNLLSVPLAFVFGIGFYFFVRIFGEPPKFIVHNSKQDLILLVGIFIIVTLHELAHGVAMQTFGAQPKYGFMWKGLMFYATSPGYAFQRNQYIIVSLAPLASLSILACCGILIFAGTSLVWLLAIWATINASAAIGDLWITTIVLGYPSNAYVIDERDGMRISMPQSESGVE